MRGVARISSAMMAALMVMLRDAEEDISKSTAPRLV
jgi:hypothetical protein